VLSISEFTSRAKALLEGAFDPVTVRGEVSNLRRQGSGHAYLTLKDAGSQLSAVIFRGDALRIRFPLRDGMQVVATGAVSIYEPRGTYQLIVRTLVEDGEGRLQREFERLRRKLAAEGLFERARKRPLPPLPRVIGIVTSPTGAALQDFLRILGRRGWRGRIVVLPARVQGVEAAGEVAAAIALAANLGILDLLVVARGGGSLEDLWPFNEEGTVRAVAASPVAVISAVGHETDFTLCDFAADIRAETPSAAAELISSGHIAATGRVNAARQWLDGRAARGFEAISRRAAFAGARLDACPPARMAQAQRFRLDDLRNRLRAAPALAAHHHRARLASALARLEVAAPKNRLRLQAARLHALAAALRRPPPRELARQAGRLQAAAVALERGARLRRAENTRALAALGQRLRAAGVEETLRRGFALVRGHDGHLVGRAADIASQVPVRIRFADGELEAVARPKKT
jgi:exodeoxyribonuclease VII large subunit